uniref:Os08g0442700 protein n=1 Tax=Macrostomum lignano TaxID=282301 RepID=A0A1I8HEB8_9PLAT
KCHGAVANLLPGRRRRRRWGWWIKQRQLRLRKQQRHRKWPANQSCPGGRHRWRDSQLGSASDRFGTGRCAGYCPENPSSHFSIGRQPVDQQEAGGGGGPGSAETDDSAARICQRWRSRRRSPWAAARPARRVQCARTANGDAIHTGLWQRPAAFVSMETAGV